MFPPQTEMAALSWLRGKECFLPQTEWLPIPDSGVKNVRMAAYPSYLKQIGFPLSPDSGVKNGRMTAYISYLQ
jgi:hypothetical protein